MNFVPLGDITMHTPHSFNRRTRACAGSVALLIAGWAPAWAQSPPAAAAKAERADCQASRERGAPTDDESLALTAIEGLMAAPPERAIPLLKRVVAGPQSLRVKQRALFVLGQFDKPEAVAILVELARSANLSMKCEAIRSIGIGGNPEALAALAAVHASADAPVRKEVLKALMIAGRKADVLQIAKNAKTEAEADEAIHTLSVMGATAELRELGGNPKSGRKLVKAYALTRDLQSLRGIASSAEDMAVRVDAVRSMGLIGDEAAKTALRNLYTQSKEQPLREAALEGLLICGDQAGVLALYRAATSSEEKRRLLRQLSIMGGDAALDAIDAALGKAPATKP
jgi:HEAT repeat protein